MLTAANAHRTKGYFSCVGCEKPPGHPRPTLFASPGWREELATLGITLQRRTE